MEARHCEFVDSRLRRSPPDREDAVPCGQARENEACFPSLAHRSAAAHKLHSATATEGLILNLFPGIMFTITGKPALAYSPPEPVQPTGTTAVCMAQKVCVIVSLSDRQVLEAIVADRNRPRKHVERAQVVLATAERGPVQPMAAWLGVNRQMVWS